MRDFEKIGSIVDYSTKMHISFIQLYFSLNSFRKKNIHLIEFKSNSHRNQTLTFYGNLKTVKHKIELRGGSLMQSPTFKRSSEFLNKLYRFISCNEIKNGQVKPKGGKTVESDVKMRKNAEKCG